MQFILPSLSRELEDENSVQYGRNSNLNLLNYFHLNIKYIQILRLFDYILFELN